MTDVAAVRVSRCLSAVGKGFVTQAVERLALTLEGIPGDVHFGFTRLSGGREPWHPRRTEIRNDRQVTLVCADELAKIAANLGVEQVLPEWLGANLVIEGFDKLTKIPRGTRLLFASGATLYLNGENQPCRGAGGEVAAHYTHRSGLDLEFVKAARGLRGQIAAVERAGDICPGDIIKVRKP